MPPLHATAPVLAVPAVVLFQRRHCCLVSRTPFHPRHANPNRHGKNKNPSRAGQLRQERVQRQAHEVQAAPCGQAESRRQMEHTPFSRGQTCHFKYTFWECSSSFQQVWWFIRCGASWRLQGCSLPGPAPPRCTVALC